MTIEDVLKKIETEDWCVGSTFSRQFAEIREIVGSKQRNLSETEQKLIVDLICGVHKAMGCGYIKRQLMEMERTKLVMTICSFVR